MPAIPAIQPFAAGRTIVIPVQDSVDRLHPERLTIYLGMEDEQPEGPLSFDVLSKGGFAIADPLLDRIVFYDTLGNYKDQADTGFPVSRIKTIDENTWMIQSATSDEIKSLEQTSGQNNRNFQITPSSSVFESTSYGAVLLKNNRAIAWRTLSGQVDSIHIVYEGEENLVGVQCLDTDADGNTAVSLETATSSDSIAANVEVRIYDVNKNLQSTISDIEKNMLIYPIDQLRFRKGKLYQMIVLENQARIRVWNML